VGQDPGAQPSTFLTGGQLETNDLNRLQAQCLFWVKNGSVGASSSFPLYPTKQTSTVATARSVSCQQPKATVALHKVPTLTASPRYTTPPPPGSPSASQGVCEKSKAFSRLFAAASRLPRGAKSQRVSMNFKIEVVSYVVLSTKRRLA
jgi:hypothetical protein